MTREGKALMDYRKSPVSNFFLFLSFSLSFSPSGISSFHLRLDLLLENHFKTILFFFFFKTLIIQKDS